MDYLDAIRKFEGFTPRATWDYKQNSNGFGTRARHPGEVIDRNEAERRLAGEVAQARAIVDRFAPNLDEGTKAALTSLTYNAGDKWTTAGLGEAVRSGDLGRMKELFLQYNKAGGEVLPGLANRRAAESAWIGSGQANQPLEAQSQPPAQTAASAPNTNANATFGSMAPPVASDTDNSPTEDRLSADVLKSLVAQLGEREQQPEPEEADPGFSKLPSASAPDLRRVLAVLKNRQRLGSTGRMT